MSELGAQRRFLWVLCRAVGAAGVVAAFTMLPVAMASTPAAAAASVTVTPSDTSMDSGSMSPVFFDGETVNVTGTYSGTGPAALYECPSTSVTVGQHLNRGACDPGNFTPVTVAANGSFAAPMVFDDPFTPTSTNQPVDCSAQPGTCEIVVDQASPGMINAATSVSSPGASNPCNGFTGSADPRISKSTTPPGGTSAPYPTVAPGQVISVHLSWGTSLSSVSTVEDCVQINGSTASSLSTQQKPGPTNGVYDTSYSVPTSGLGSNPGDVICDRGRASGTAAANGQGVTEKSAILCFSVASSAVLPESPWPALLPLSAVVGGAAVVSRRRWLRRAT